MDYGQEGGGIGGSADIDILSLFLNLYLPSGLVYTCTSKIAGAGLTRPIWEVEAYTWEENKHSLIRGRPLALSPYRVQFML